MVALDFPQGALHARAEIALDHQQSTPRSVYNDWGPLFGNHGRSRVTRFMKVEGPCASTSFGSGHLARFGLASSRR